MSETPSPEAGSGGPLDGIRVLDFTSFIAGSYGAMLLGDMGADVLKIESPGGDNARHWGPFIEGESRMFQAWNRNKRGISVNLKTTEGRQVIYDLAGDADVAMENFRPGVAARLGIDYDTLSRHNPGLIYASSSAFGGSGPYAQRPGYDPVLQSMAGAAHLQQLMNGVAAICPVAVSDYMAAVLTVCSINAALLHRERTGVGQHIETSLLQAIMTAQAQSYLQPLEAEITGPPGIFPYRMFAAADGPIFIAAGTDKFWKLFCEAIGRDDLANDPRYETNPQRVSNAAALSAEIDPIVAGRPARELEAELVAVGVPCAAVRSAEEFFDDPQVEAMAMSQVVRHPQLGNLRMAGVPWRFSQTPGAIRRPAPRLGEHTGEVLAELGYGSERIAGLEASGAVRAADTADTN
ncbi:MAG: CoA transferase [Acidobacteriota bacterium]|nr:CoA transferase [Acidobacteriota bacterium]MDE2924061.1 CoA transferase [Acidobacteriota bacterium]MDE3265023.1 CoA transferase [Acidobacteriota bacterium]